MVRGRTGKGSTAGVSEQLVKIRDERAMKRGIGSYGLKMQFDL
jgi:hypothetical protein